MVPKLLADHAAAARLSSCTVGEVILPHAPVPCPRVQLEEIFQGSWWTLERPSALNCSAAHSLACLSCGEPVIRGPILSVRWVKSACNCVLSAFTCSMIFLSASEVGSGSAAAALRAASSG